MVLHLYSSLQFNQGGLPVVIFYGFVALEKFVACNAVQLIFNEGCSFGAVRVSVSLPNPLRLLIFQCSPHALGALLFLPTTHMQGI